MKIAWKHPLWLRRTELFFFLTGKERLGEYVSDNNEQTSLCILILGFDISKFLYKYHNCGKIHHFETGLPNANTMKQCFKIYNIILKMQMGKASTLAYETWINFQNICCVSKLRKSLQRERWRTLHKDLFYKSKM